MKNESITINIENIINSLNINKKQKSILYMKINGYNKDDGEIVWENDEIKGFKLYAELKSICIEITI